LTQPTLRSICREQGNRTLTAFTRTRLAVERNEPIFAYFLFSGSKRNRTPNTLRATCFQDKPFVHSDYFLFLWAYRDSNPKLSPLKDDVLTVSPYAYRIETSDACVIYSSQTELTPFMRLKVGIDGLEPPIYAD
jgi:hypothetical protein